jgi:hypothetical protein
LVARDESARLKRLLADLTLDNEMVKELAQGSFWVRSRPRDAVRRLQEQFGIAERTACRAVGHHHATQRRPPPPVLAPEEQSAKDEKCCHRHALGAWMLFALDGSA